jgi:hypothetical protein
MFEPDSSSLKSIPSSFWSKPEQSVDYFYSRNGANTIMLIDQLLSDLNINIKEPKPLLDPYQDKVKQFGEFLAAIDQISLQAEKEGDSCDKTYNSLDKLINEKITFYKDSEEIKNHLQICKAIYSPKNGSNSINQKNSLKTLLDDLKSKISTFKERSYEELDAYIYTYVQINQFKSDLESLKVRCDKHPEQNHYYFLEKKIEKTINKVAAEKKLDDFKRCLENFQNQNKTKYTTKGEMRENIETEGYLCRDSRETIQIILQLKEKLRITQSTIEEVLRKLNSLETKFLKDENLEKKLTICKSNIPELLNKLELLNDKYIENDEKNYYYDLHEIIAKFTSDKCDDTELTTILIEFNEIYKTKNVIVTLPLTTKYRRGDELKLVINNLKSALKQYKNDSLISWLNTKLENLYSNCSAFPQENYFYQFHAILESAISYSADPGLTDQLKKINEFYKTQLVEEIPAPYYPPQKNNVTQPEQTAHEFKVCSII